VSPDRLLNVALEAELVEFCRHHEIHDKSFGAVCTMIHVTRQARLLGLPLVPQRLIARSGAQVAGLHRGAVQAILHDYGMENVQLGEVGRTNPNNVARSQAYIRLLNGHTRLDERNLAQIESWWVSRLPAHPPAHFLKLRRQPRHSADWMFSDLTAQVKRQYKQTWQSKYELVVAGLAAALLWQTHSSDDRPELPCICLAPDDPHQVEVCYANTTIFVTDFPVASVVRNICEQRQRRRQVLVVTGRQHVEVTSQVLAAANLHHYVDVLAIEQWFLIVTCGVVSDWNAVRCEVLDEVVATYNRIADSLPAVEIPRLALT
jgi:hypothetical protein